MKSWDPCMECTAQWRQKFEVQRTVKTAELTAFLCILKKVIGLTKVHVDNKGIVDGLWRGERKCIDPKAGDADLWIKIWEELHLLVSKEIWVEVEHVRAHRTKKDQKEMSNFEKFVTEGNEKAGEVAKAGASNVGRMFYGGNESKDSSTREREIRGACRFAVRSKFSLFGGRMEGLRRAQAEKENRFSWIRKEKKRSINPNGVPRPTSIDV